MSDLEKFKDDEAYYADKSYMSNSSFKLLRQSPTKFICGEQVSGIILLPRSSM